MAKILFAVVGIAALCCLAFAETVREKCEPEIQQIQEMMQQFEDVKPDEIPQCYKAIAEEVRDWGWGSFDEIMSSLKKLPEKAKEEETQACAEELQQKFNEIKEEKSEGLMNSIRNFEISDECKNSGKDAFMEFFEKISQ